MTLQRSGIYFLCGTSFLQMMVSVRSNLCRDIEMNVKKLHVLCQTNSYNFDL